VQQLGQLYDQLAQYRAAMQQYQQKLTLYQVGVCRAWLHVRLNGVTGW
jgi:hypothetical protein